MRWSTFRSPGPRPSLLRSVHGAAAVLLAALLAPAGSLAQPVQRAPSAEDLASITELPISCTNGAVEVTKAWNETGFSKGCYRDGVANGPIVFWERGYLNLTGAFSDGRKDGGWTVFNEDGSRYVTIHFEGGVKTGKTFHSAAAPGAEDRR